MSPNRNRNRNRNANGNANANAQRASDLNRMADAVTAKILRDNANSLRKHSAALAPSRELRRGSKAAWQASFAVTDVPVPDNRRARRLLARYGTGEEIREFIDRYGYDCTISEFRARYRAGGNRAA